jgi:hypothetical protein
MLTQITIDFRMTDPLCLPGDTLQGLKHRASPLGGRSYRSIPVHTRPDVRLFAVIGSGKLPAAPIVAASGERQRWGNRFCCAQQIRRIRNDTDALLGQIRRANMKWLSLLGVV